MLCNEMKDNIIRMYKMMGNWRMQRIIKQNILAIFKTMLSKKENNKNSHFLINPIHEECCWYPGN